jgi:fission process protein 1
MHIHRYALIKTLLRSMQRYVAYTSDISEPLRPLALPYLVPGAYVISWSYVLGDAVHEGHKASCYNKQVLNSEAAAATRPRATWGC